MASFRPKIVLGLEALRISVFKAQVLGYCEVSPGSVQASLLRFSSGLIGLFSGFKDQASISLP